MQHFNVVNNRINIMEIYIICKYYNYYFYVLDYSNIIMQHIHIRKKKLCFEIVSYTFQEIHIKVIFMRLYQYIKIKRSYIRTIKLK